MTELTSILHNRGAIYGDFETSAAIMQSLKSIVRSRSEKLTSSQLEALEMICHKIGRILNGDPNHVDNWLDIAGYPQLEADILEYRDKFDSE